MNRLEIHASIDRNDQQLGARGSAESLQYETACLPFASFFSFDGGEKAPKKSVPAKCVEFRR